MRERACLKAWKRRPPFSRSAHPSLHVLEKEESYVHSRWNMAWLSFFILPSHLLRYLPPFNGFVNVEHTRILGCAKRPFPCWVKLGEKVAFCLPATGLRTFSSPIQTTWEGYFSAAMSAGWHCQSKTRLTYTAQRVTQMK